MIWKNIAGRIALAAFALLGMIALAAFLFVRTGAFHRFVLQKITQATSDATGGRLEVGSFTIHWRGLSLDFYGVKLHGTETSTQPPLFAVDHLDMGLSIVSILRRQINLSRVILDRPEFNLRVDAQGRSNLPASANAGKTSSSGETVAKLFDMAVQSVIVSSGVIGYNDQQAQLAADLEGFHLRVGFDHTSQGYRADLGYDRGLLTFQDFKPLAHHAEMQLTASRSGVVVDQLVLQTAESRLAASGNLVNYLSPVLQASYQASLQTNELAAIMHVPSLPAGTVAISGNARYQSGSSRPFVDTVYVDGMLECSALALRMGGGLAEAKSVHATYRLDDGNLYVENATSELLGGTGAGKFEMAHLGGNSASKFEASLSNVSLGEISRVLLPASAKVHVTGQAILTAQGGWTSDIHNISGHMSATITGPLQRADERTASPGLQVSASRAVNIPINANIDVSYDGARSTALFEPSSIRTASADFSFAGALGAPGDRSALNVAAQTSDLREFASFIAAVDGGIRASTGSVALGSSSSPLQNLDISGSAHFMGRILGTMKNPQITGQLAADNFEIAGSRWRTLQTNVEASPTAIGLSDASLAGAQQGAMNVTVRVSLADWSLTPASMIVGQVSANHMSIADLERIVRVHYPVTGDLSANISFDGSERNPAGHGSLTITNASAWNEPIATLAVQFQGDGNSIHSTEQLRTGAGNLSANIGFSPQTGQYDAAVNIPGLALGRLRTVEARTNEISGTLSGTATGRGTLQNPQIDANLQIAQLQIHDQTIRLAQARLNVAQQHATFTLQSDLEQGALQAKGDADLTGEQMASASIDIRALPISLLLAKYLPRSGPQFGGKRKFTAHFTAR